jgi:hypothetical protein
VHVEVKDGLASARPDVHEDAIVLQTGVTRGLGDELEHPLRLVGRKLGHVPERVHVPLGQHEQMDVRLRIDVPDRDEAVCLRDVVAFANELAEEAVVRQRGSPAR